MGDQWDGDVGHEERYLLNLLEDDRLTRDDLSRAMNRIRYRMMSRITPPEAMSLAVRQYRWRLIGTSAWGGWFDGNPPAELHDTQTEIERRSLYARPAPEVKDAIPGWPDPLESPLAQAIRDGKIDDVDIRDLFDKMERELQVLRRTGSYREVKPTPAPAASDELVGLRKLALAQHHLADRRRIELAAARIEAAAAEMGRLRAELADYNDERTRDLSAALERAEAAEAECDALREALAEISNAYTAHSYSDAMDAVQALKDIAREALK